MKNWFKNIDEFKALLALLILIAFIVMVFWGIYDLLSKLIMKL